MGPSRPFAGSLIGPLLLPLVHGRKTSSSWRDKEIQVGVVLLAVAVLELRLSRKELVFICKDIRPP